MGAAQGAVASVAASPTPRAQPRDTPPNFSRLTPQAKCYLYHPTGTCHFVVRLYSERAGDDAFLVELQRRKGCARIFRRAFDAMLAALAQDGVLSVESEAGKRVHALALAPPASAASAAPALAIAGVDFAGADGGASAAPAAAPVTAADAHAIVEAFLPLTAMLAQSFDDIVTPAAQSIASLSTSRRVVAALGMRARAGAEALAAGRRSPEASPASRQSSTGTVTSPAPSSAAATASEVERRDTQIVYNLLQNLVVRALQPTVSLEARTACAMALANLAQDAACAEALAQFNSAVAVFLALKDVEVSARAAALRRELARVALRVMTASPAAAAAVAGDSGAATAVRALATDPRYHGHDAAFDRLAAAASELVAASGQ